MESKEQIQVKFQQHMEGNLPVEDRAILSQAAEAYSLEEWQEMVAPIVSLGPKDENFNTEAWNERIETILQTQRAKLINIKRWLVAACIIMLLGIGIARVLQQNPPAKQDAKQDVPAPLESRAYLTLNDGTHIYLDSTQNGSLASQGGVAVIQKAKGELVYQPQTQGMEVTYNTINNPRGSRNVSLTLADGTRVWLNAASGLKYPTAFNGNSREVEVWGEAYFEVSQNAKQPFTVKQGGQRIQVLGTSFNVNAYPEDGGLKLTLVDGAVKLGDKRIKPGQQAIERNGSISITNDAPLDEVLAWKNGLFRLNNASLPQIMRELSRYYDVDVQYASHINETYTVNVPRTVPVSQIFKFIEMSGGVHFKIEGRRITVSQ